MNKNSFSDGDVHEIWNQWLDGETPSRIATYTRFENGFASAKSIKSVLSKEPPASIQDDDRFKFNCRALWVSCDGRYNTIRSTYDSFVIVFSPRSFTTAAFHTALRAIRRDFKYLHPEASMTLNVLEGIEVPVARKFANEKGYLAWTFDQEGNVSRYEPQAPQSDAELKPGL